MLVRQALSVDHKAHAALTTAEQLIEQMVGSEAFIINPSGLLIGQLNKEGYKEAVATEAWALLKRA